MKLSHLSTSSLPMLALAAICLAQGGPGGAQAPQTPPAQTTTQPAKAQVKPAAQPAKKAKAPTKPKAVKKRAAPKPAKPPKPPWDSFKLNSKTTMFLDFTEASPDMIISIFSRTSGITILKDPSFKAPLTVTSAKSVKLEEAFEIFNTVLNLNEYELQKRGHLLVVAKMAPPAPAGPPAGPPGGPGGPGGPVMPHMGPPGRRGGIVAGPTAAPAATDDQLIKVYPITYANASEIARVVNEVFSPEQLQLLVQQAASGGGMPVPQMPGQPPPGMPGSKEPPKIVRASSEDYSNSVVVNAPKKYQDMAADLIHQLDKSTETPLVTEIFKLRFVTTDEVTQAIDDVLTANAPTGRGKGKESNQNQNQFFFNPFGGGGEQQKNGGQSVVAIKQTNSVIVSATKANMELVRQLIRNIDQENAWVGTTFVVKLHDAKASDVATVLNQAFTQRRDVNQSPFFFVFNGEQNNQSNNALATDVNDQGEVVNVRDLTGKVNVIAEPNTNSLIVVTAPSNMKMVQKIIDQIDTQATQVMIETVIVEANLERNDQLGVEWNFTQNGLLGKGTTGTGSTNFGLQSSTTPLQGLSYTLSGNMYKAFLNALQTDTKFKVLDSPRIFTSNNVKATINVSQKLPYINNTQEGALGNEINNYAFLDVGVILNVTPRITSSGQVSMDIDQTASDLQGYTSYNAPIVNNREATTTVSVNDGDTIVLGGIISTSKNRTTNKIPLLGDIPLLGNLFKQSTNDIQRTELLVLLTPHIVHNPAEAQKLKEQEIKKMSRESQNSIKSIHP